MKGKIKGILAVFAIIVITSLTLNAQEVGIRFGGTSANKSFNGGAAVDAIFGVGQFSRIHADIGFYKGVGIDAVWDFLYKPLGNEAFYWYLGVGPSMYIGDDFWLGVSGEIGLEYRFNIPLALGLDWRPTFWILESTEFGAGSFGLNVRYIFGE